MSGQTGFSLIEALVALMILALSATALIGATEAYVGRVRGLEDRAAAQWVAENLLTELQIDRSARAIQSRDVTMLGRPWTARVEYSPTSDPDLSRVTILVSPAGVDDPLVRFGGFVDQGAQ